jgi:hypothetical protein
MARFKPSAIFAPSGPSKKLRRIAVSVGPGQSVLTITPLLTSSRATVLPNAIIPPLQAEYTASPEDPTRPASEATLTTRPKPRAAMPLSTT